MKNWFDAITPHEDIRKGHFDEAVFATNLMDRNCKIRLANC
jgi:hypothetical protein